MHIENSRFDLLDLTALLIDANKQFTNALKAKRPHTELVKIYADIQAIHAQITQFKEPSVIAA